MRGARARLAALLPAFTLAPPSVPVPLPARASPLPRRASTSVLLPRPPLVRTFPATSQRVPPLVPLPASTLTRMVSRRAPPLALLLASTLAVTSAPVRLGVRLRA